LHTIKDNAFFNIVKYSNFLVKFFIQQLSSINHNAIFKFLIKSVKKIKNNYIIRNNDFYQLYKNFKDNSSFKMGNWINVLD